MLELIVPNISHKEQWEEIMKEWDDSQKRPAIFFQESYERILTRFYELVLSDDAINKVPKSSFYFLLNTDNNRVIGFFWFRHHLNYSEWSVVGGHIGYGIRPTERGKGYAKEGLRLTLLEAKKIAIDKILITCDDDNIASAKVIEANGGILEKIFEKDGILRRRYWIEIAY